MRDLHSIWRRYRLNTAIFFYSRVNNSADKTEKYFYPIMNKLGFLKNVCWMIEENELHFTLYLLLKEKV